MKVVILAGGLGTRISEESHLRPKPMIEIGGQPILWHIMKLYAHHGFRDFVICCGYRQQMIKQYFADSFLHASDVQFDLGENSMQVLSSASEPWKVTLVDTGLGTMTGGRLLRVREHLGGGPFMLTYGDGVSNVAMDELVAFHRTHGRLATMTAIQPESRFGIMEMDGDQVLSFREKNPADAVWINGGFMVLEDEVFDYIEGGDGAVFERQPLESLAAADQLMAYRHRGYWQCMDTQRDKQRLEELWADGSAPWKVW